MQQGYNFLRSSFVFVLSLNPLRWKGDAHVRSSKMHCVHRMKLVAFKKSVKKVQKMNASFRPKVNCVLRSLRPRLNASMAYQHHTSSSFVTMRYVVDTLTQSYLLVLASVPS